MPEPTELQPILREHRAATEDRMLAALDRLSPGWHGRRRLRLAPQLEYALLHHTLYECRRATRDGDRARARAALAVWEQDENAWAPAVPTAAGLFLMADRASCRRSDDDRFLSPIYAFVHPSADVTPHLPWDLLRQGLEHVLTAGLGDIPAESLAVVVLLNWRPPTGTTHSYSVAALPGTVFADWTDEAVRWGEILLHESSHSWLNECLRALDIRLPSQPTWFSEWKQAVRPAYGVLHAAFAFSLMVRYFGHFARASPPGSRCARYCAARLGTEHRVLARMEADVREAAAFVSDDRLRSVVLGQVELALDSQERSITV